MNRAEPYALGPGQGRVIDLRDFEMTVKASEEETGGVVSVLEAEEPPGFGPPVHVHHDCAEAFYVLEGAYIMNLEITRSPVRPGRSSSSRRARGTAFALATYRAGSSTSTSPRR